MGNEECLLVALLEHLSLRNNLQPHILLNALYTTRHHQSLRKPYVGSVARHSNPTRY